MKNKLLSKEFIKVKHVINSCRNLGQLECSAKTMMEFFKKKNPEMTENIENYFYKKRESLTF